jgi:hypothetical protein
VGLPPDSATWRGDVWSQGEELLATIAEVVDLWGLRFAGLQGVKPGKMPDAIKIPRPGEGEREKKPNDPAEISRFMSKFGGKGKP